MSAGKEIKTRVNMSDLLMRYCPEQIERDDFYICPLHNEKTASFKIYDDNFSYYCFGCGAGGDGIDFIAKLFELSPSAAIQRIDYDFNLGLFRKLTIKEKHEKKRQEIKRMQEQEEKKQAIAYHENAYRKLVLFFHWLRKQGLEPESDFITGYIERLLYKYYDGTKLIDWDVNARLKGIYAGIKGVRLWDE